MAAAVEVAPLAQTALGMELRAAGRAQLPPGVLVFSIEGPFFFGAVESLERALGATHNDPRCIIIRLNQVPFMDITGIQALEEASGNLRRRGVRVLLCEARANVLRKLVRSGLVNGEALPQGYWDSFAGALSACD
jgi:SulP family sulfate permease